MTGLKKFLYVLISVCLVPILWLRLLWRSRQVVGYRYRMMERFLLTAKSAPHLHGCLWVHAVSVGESIVAVKLIRTLRQRQPNLKILLTTTTPTGADQAQKTLPKDVPHVYMPYDFPWAVRHFLDAYQPSCAVMIEGEIWPLMIASLAARNIPCLVANARMSQRSYRSYQRFSWLLSEVWPMINWVGSQTRADGARYIRLGVPRSQVKVLGNLKYDVALPDDFQQRAAHFRETLIETVQHVVVAASTHPGEEQQVLEAFQLLLKEQPNTVLVLVPRHIERCPDIRSVAEDLGLQVVQRTHNSSSLLQLGGVYLVDTMGELPMFYGAADVCFVGGSLVEVGGHNPIEPALANCPVVVGPYLFNFTDMFRDLKLAGGCKVIRSVADLAATWQWCLVPSQGQQLAVQAMNVVLEAQGVVPRYISVVEHYLPPKQPCTAELAVS